MSGEQNHRNTGLLVIVILASLVFQQTTGAYQTGERKVNAQVALRNVRRDAMDYIKKLKKTSDITEDDQKNAEKDLQELTDKYIKKVDDACTVKEKELMEL